MTNTTTLLAIRTQDGRLRYASYKDDTEKARILAWAQSNNARVGNAADAQQSVLARVA